DERSRDELPPRVPLRRRQLCPRLLELEQLVHAQEGFAGPGVLGDDSRLPHLSPGVGPAAYLLGCRVLGTAARLTAEDCVVDRVGVGLDVAGEASEHLADGGACVL